MAAQAEQADQSASANAVAAPTSSSESNTYENLIDPKDLRIYSVKSKDAQRYKDAGWATPQLTSKVSREEIDKPITDWRATAKGAAVSAFRGVPFGMTALSHLVDQSTYADIAGAGEDFEKEHPVLAPALGAATSIAIGGAAFKGAGLLADAAGLSAAPLAARLPAVLTGATARATAAGALENAVLGQAYRVDNAAIEHALHPAGQEKLTFSANEILFEAALGAGAPLALKGLGATLGKAGRSLSEKGLNISREAPLSRSGIESLKTQGRWDDYKSAIDPLIGLSNEQIAHRAKIQIGLSNQGLEVLKGRYGDSYLTNARKEDLADAIVRIIGDPTDPVQRRTVARLNARRFNLQRVQDLTKYLRDNIVWPAGFKPGSANQRYRDAYLQATNLGKELIERKAGIGANDAKEWVRLNQNYSNHALILGNLKNQGTQTVASLAESMMSAGFAGATLAATGIANIGVAGAFGRAAGWSVVHHIQFSHLGPLANRLGKGLQAADVKIGNAIEAGLYGAPGQFHKYINPLRFEDTAAQISLAASDPEKAVSNLQETLIGQGVPDEISVPIAQKQVAGLVHLHKSRPVRNDSPDVVTQSQGDPVQNHRWMEQVRTFQDPTYGITHPTRDNLTILKNFFPETLFAAQQSAHLAVSRDPSLSLDSKLWASKLLERPISNLASPTFAQTLAKARAQDAQARQGPGGSPPGRSSAGPKDAVQSTLSRADELQNRA